MIYRNRGRVLSPFALWIAHAVVIALCLALGGAFAAHWITSQIGAALPWLS